MDSTPGPAARTGRPIKGSDMAPRTNWRRFGTNSVLSLGDEDYLPDGRTAFQRAMGIGNLVQREGGSAEQPEPPVGDLIEQPGEIPLQRLPADERQQCKSTDGLVLSESLLEIGSIEIDPAKRAKKQMTFAS